MFRLHHRRRGMVNFLVISSSTLSHRNTSISKATNPRYESSNKPPSITREGQATNYLSIPYSRLTPGCANCRSCSLKGAKSSLLV